MDDPSTAAWSWTHIWLAATTIAGGVVAFFTKRLVEEIDCKADQKDVDRLEATIADILKRQDANREADIERQDNYHRDNTNRFDRLFSEMRRP